METLEIRAVIAAIQQRHGLPSQPQVSRFLGVTEKTLSNWMHARSIPDDSKTIQIAELAGIDPLVLLAYHHAQRAPDELTRVTWLKVVRKLSATAKCAVQVKSAKTTQAVDLIRDFWPAAPERLI